MLRFSSKILTLAGGRLTGSLGGLLAAGLVMTVAAVSLWPEGAGERTAIEILPAERKSVEMMVSDFRAAEPDTSPDLLTAYADTLSALQETDDAEKKEALAAFEAGDLDRAVSTLESLARRQASGNEPRILDAAATLRQAAALAYTGDRNRAVRNYQTALTLTPSNPDLARELGQVYVSMGQYDKAEQAFIRILQTDGVVDRFARAAALKNLGDVEINRTRYEVAANYYNRSFGEYEAAEDPRGMAESLVNLGVTQQLAGNHDAAEVYHRRALALYEETDDELGVARSLINLGQVEMTRTNIPLAEDYLRRGVSANLALGQSVTAARGLGNLGLIEKARGNLDAAQDYHQRALALYEELTDMTGMARELGNLGNVENDRGNFAAAEEFHKRSLALDEKTGRTAGIATTLANLGGLAEVQGNQAAACAYWLRAAGLFEEIGSTMQFRVLSGWMADANCGLGQ